MRVFTFGNGQAEGDGDMISVLGGKGAGLAAMSAMGVPVPPGFTVPPIATEVLGESGGLLPDNLGKEIERGLAHIEALTGLELGNPACPLLVSVRSGASVSMPGMMDTVLNVGMTEAVAAGLTSVEGERRFALDSHRRFLEMFSEVAGGLDPDLLEDVRAEVLDLSGNNDIHNLEAHWIEALVAAYRQTLSEHSVMPPANARAQIDTAIIGVYRSWNNPRAPSGTARPTGSSMTSGPRSPCRRWCSAIGVQRRRPASPSPAIPTPERRACSVSIYPKPRGRTW
jgi:pyruvate,orthophosphate dikinase